jgi:hypothetical protein
VRNATLVPILAFLAACLAAPGCGPATAPVAPKTPSPPAATSAPARVGEDLRFAPDIAARLRQFPHTPIDYDHSLVKDRDKETLEDLIAASREIDEIFLRQVAEDNPSLLERLNRMIASGRPDAITATDYFLINKGPWDRVKENEPFIGSRSKPPGAAFYPVDMSKQEFEAWVAAHPQDKETFQSLFTVIRRDGNRLVAIPYSKYYAPFLSRASEKLRAAGDRAGNASLKKYLSLLAAALLSDDYYASDLAWMDLDSDIEVILGPYEVYEDGLFNYKAAFESFIGLRDPAESARLAVYAAHLRDMEENLPIPQAHKNFSRKFESPIRVVQEVYTAGDARKGVQTSAFNLPNDERVREAKGSKKVLLKNVMEAKFRLSGQPIAERILDPDEKKSLSFDAYFDDTLFHELSHGLGPGVITGPDGKKVESRLLLKDLYSTVEECKADVVGAWNVLYAMDRKWLTGYGENVLFTTVSGLLFRSMRFGLDDAHGGGAAVQWNWYREKKAIERSAQGRFRVVPEKFREAVRSLAGELLEIEATGDYARARKLLDRYGKATLEIRTAIAQLTDIPVDLAPVYAAPGEK